MCSHTIYETNQEFIKAYTSLPYAGKDVVSEPEDEA